MTLGPDGSDNLVQYLLGFQYVKAVLIGTSVTYVSTHQKSGAEGVKLTFVVDDSGLRCIK